jgi:predicted RND superfamily exporter protein
MVILPRKIENVDTIATLLRKQKAADGPKSLIANVQTLQDFIPKNQSEKIKTIQSIEQRLNPQLLKRIGNSISPEQMSMIQTFITPESKVEIHATDLPGLILSKFTEKDGSLGKLVLIEPPLTNETGNGDLLFKFIHDLRSVADSVEPGAPLAGSLPISADLLESILLDGPKATAFAFFSVVILLILLFRKPKVILPATLALILGILWLAGFIFAFWFKINFLNFIALPISFGIGVDYGVNIFQRYREEGAHSMFKVIQDTGSAVALCSFTTMVGYGSLLIAQNRAFVSFGLLAVIGELTCLIAALFTLPAALLWMHQIHQTRLRKAT